MHAGPEPWVTRLLTALGGPKPRLLGSSATLWGMEGQPGDGDILGVQTRGALTLRHSSPEPSPAPLSLARPPGSACTLTPTCHLHPCWSQEVEAERGNQST